MNQPRMNIYGFPHKGLRLALSKLSLLSGSTDYSDEDSLSMLKELTSEIVDLLHLHVHSEESVVLPALEEKVSGSTATNLEEHKTLENEISEFVKQLESITVGSNPVSGAKFYESIFNFYSNYINHMAMEEKDVNCLIWENCTDEEIMSWHEKIMSTLTPNQISTWLKYIVPALNPFERTIIMSGFKANAPAEFFDSIVGMLKEYMTEMEHSQMIKNLAQQMS